MKLNNHESNECLLINDKIEVQHYNISIINDPIEVTTFGDQIRKFVEGRKHYEGEFELIGISLHFHEIQKITLLAYSEVLEFKNFIINEINYNQHRTSYKFYADSLEEVTNYEEVFNTILSQGVRI